MKEKEDLEMSKVCEPIERLRKKHQQSEGIIVLLMREEYKLGKKNKGLNFAFIDV